jgi:hypothetical protein
MAQWTIPTANAKWQNRMHHVSRIAYGVDQFCPSQVICDFQRDIFKRKIVS